MTGRAFPGPDPDALFRFEVISSLIHLEPGRGRLRGAIEELAERRWEHPRKGSIQLSFFTIQGWLYLYKKDGLTALTRQPRADRGRSRRIDGELAERIEELALRVPVLDGPNIVKEIEADPRFDRAPSLSTLYRFLRARGLDLRRPPSHADHRAYAFDMAGDCWQMDVMYGPKIPTRGGGTRQSYLFAILDDATRLVPHAQFYTKQHLQSLKDALHQGFLKRGLPRRLYTDQGRIFKSRALGLICARLGIHLLHTRPYKPQGKAKIERWFGTVRRSFLRRLGSRDLALGLDHVNRLLFGYVEGEYHVAPHRGLDGATPLDRWIRLSEGLRTLPQDLDLDELFSDEASRRVAKDGTFKLHNQRFEAGPLFIGQKITLRFDPFDLRTVRLLATDGERVLYPVDLAQNRRVKREQPEAVEPTDPTLRSLESAVRRLEEDGQ